jgi:hypothetical protein
MTDKVSSSKGAPIPRHGSGRRDKYWNLPKEERKLLGEQQAEDDAVSIFGDLMSDKDSKGDKR